MWYLYTRMYENNVILTLRRVFLEISQKTTFYRQIMRFQKLLMLSRLSRTPIAER